MMQFDDAKLATMFSSHGLRCTRQRKALYSALAATKEHPTADQLYRDVQNRTSGLSLATVYNTLEAFCRSGLAQKLAAADGSARYDANHEAHVHLRCTRTGRVADAPEHLSHKLHESLSKDVMRKIEAALGFKIDHVQIEFVGQFE